MKMKRMFLLLMVLIICAFYVSAQESSLNTKINGHDISDNIVAYSTGEDDSSSIIYILDLSTKKQTKLPRTGLSQNGPKIYGDWVMYSDFIGSRYNLNVYNLKDGKNYLIKQGVHSSSADIFLDAVVYNHNEYLYKYNLKDMTTDVVSDKSEYSRNIGLYGNYLIYLQIDKHTIDIYDIANKVVSHIKISDNLINDAAGSPVIFENKVVWLEADQKLYSYSINGLSEPFIYDKELLYELGKKDGYIVNFDYYDGKIVMILDRLGLNGLYVYDTKNRQLIKVVETESKKFKPVINKGKVIWKEKVKGNDVLFGYNLYDDGKIYMLSDRIKEVESSYFRDDKLSPQNFNEGVIIVAFKVGMENEGISLVKSYGLSYNKLYTNPPFSEEFLKNYIATNGLTLIVYVPEGEELQWINKFNSNDVVKYAEYDYKALGAGVGSGAKQRTLETTSVIADEPTKVSDNFDNNIINRILNFFKNIFKSN